MTRRFVLGFIAALVLTGGLAEAQEKVATRFYIVPKIGSGTGPMVDDTTPDDQGSFRPKYMRALGVAWSAMDYGKESTMLVGADVTPTQNTTLASNIDVTSIPANLDGTVSAGALVTIQNKLEAIKIPGDWVTTATTYRQVVGTIGRIFLLMQRFDGMYFKTFFESGITLATRANELTAAQRNALQDAAVSLNLDITFIQPTTTVRAIFKTWVQQMGPFTLRGETF